MSFSYDDTLLTVRDQVRQRIADTHQHEGPRPTGRNFSNENIDVTLSSGTVFGISVSGDLEKAALYYYVILESAWAQAALIESEGDTSINAVAVVRNYKEKINRLRNDLGIVPATKLNGWIPNIKATRFNT